MIANLHQPDHNCLNCHYEVSGNYCQNCGQKASIHRYSFKHFVEHDIIHGVWHVDKGVLYTVKQLFTRPGYAVREFIQGERARLFNFVTLIILILGVSALLAPYIHIRLADILPLGVKETMNEVEALSTKYPKLVIVILIPIYSLFSWLWFRKAKLNYSEHLVLNSYKTSAELIIGLLFSIITIIYTNTFHLLIIYYIMVVFGGFVYSVWFYSQFFKNYAYSKKASIFRAVMIPISYVLLSVLIGIVFGIIKALS
ncbi:MAG: DUF3667 domain-containing protein [Pedobacter sp.]